jgi:hypothetical protein
MAGWAGGRHMIFTPWPSLNIHGGDSSDHDLLQKATEIELQSNMNKEESYSQSTSCKAFIHTLKEHKVL